MNEITCTKLQRFYKTRKRVRRTLQNVCEVPVYRLSKKRVSISGVQNVTFVCQGNICRSVFAEHWLRAQVPRPEFRIESCGLNVTLAITPPPDALQVGSAYGVDLSQHLSKSINEFDIVGADLVVAMQYSHWRRLTAMAPELRRKTVLLREFAPFPHNMLCNIYDPYGQGQDEFDRCFGLMEKALKGLMARIREDS